MIKIDKAAFAAILDEACGCFAEFATVGGALALELDSAKALGMMFDLGATLGNNLSDYEPLIADGDDDTDPQEILEALAGARYEGLGRRQYVVWPTIQGD